MRPENIKNALTSLKPQILISLFLMLGMTACGQKGALYLPEEKMADVVNVESADKADVKKNQKKLIQENK